MKTIGSDVKWPRTYARNYPNIIYLTKCIHLLDLESQLPHTIVDLLFTITN